MSSGSRSHQTALQEAIQRARQLAAKISQNAPVKRTASEMDDHASSGQVKVTLAYEKPPNSDNNRESRSSHRNDSNDRTSDHHRTPTNNNNNNNNYNNNLYDNNSAESGPPSSRSRVSGQYGAGGGAGPNGGGSTTSGGAGCSNTMLLNSPPRGGSMLNQNYGSSSSNDDKIEIIIPHAVIGLVIGRGGENIKRIQTETGAIVRVDPNTVDEKGNKVCTITGTKQAVEDAHRQVSNVIENSSTGKRPRLLTEGSDEYRMKIPASRTGAIIGKGGETIKTIKQQSGCDIELDKHSKECAPDESLFIIRGTQDRILTARAMIESRLASRGRDGDHGGHRSGSHSRGGGGGGGGGGSSGGGGGGGGSGGASAGSGAGPGSVGANLGAGVATGANAAPVGQLYQMVAPQQDYTEQWIQYYLANGRPDYAEQIIAMKKAASSSTS